MTIRRGSGYIHEAGMRGGENSDLRNHLCRGREPHAFSGKISTITTEHCRPPTLLFYHVQTKYSFLPEDTAQKAGS